MQYTLWKTFRFEASHQLVDHDGKCARLHGHSWVFRIYVRCYELEKTGPKRNMGVDYSMIGRVGHQIANELDHRHLNDLYPGASGHVTSEYLARSIYNEATTELGPMVNAVEVEETCTSGCRYEHSQTEEG